MDDSPPRQSLEFISKTILRAGGGASRCHAEGTRSSIYKRMGTSQGGQRSGVRSQWGPAREMDAELWWDFWTPTARREAGWVEAGLCESPAVALFHVQPRADRLSPPSSPAKPDDINDNDRCHVLSYLALHKLSSETGQVVYYRRYFTAQFTLIWRIYVRPASPPVQRSCLWVWDRELSREQLPPQVGWGQANIKKSLPL